MSRTNKSTPTRIELSCACGPDLKDSRIQPGSQVLYGKFAGSELKVDGKELVILREDEVLGKLTPVTLTEALKQLGL